MLIPDKLRELGVDAIAHALGFLAAITLRGAYLLGEYFATAHRFFRSLGY